jgi:hypothetical protein
MMILMTTLKQFLKPDWRKIVVFVVLFVMLFLSFDGKYPIDYMYVAMGGCKEENGKMQCIGLGYGYNWAYFILDIFIWTIISYILSCLIVWIYDKFRKNR